MFTFDLSTLDDRDINDAIETLYKCACIEGQRDNIGLQYLLGLICEEGERRNGGDIGGEIEIHLPIGEMTNAHVWCLLKFAGAAVTSVAKGEPSAMGRFFGLIILEIESVTQRITAAAMN